MLKVNGYGGRQAKGNEKRQCFKGWETLVTNKTKSNRIVQLVTQLLNRGENAIVYCSTKASTEKFAKFLISENKYIKDIDSEKVIRLTNHIT